MKKVMVLIIGIIVLFETNSIFAQNIISNIICLEHFKIINLENRNQECLNQLINLEVELVLSYNEFEDFEQEIEVEIINLNEHTSYPLTLKLIRELSCTCDIVDGLSYSPFVYSGQIVIDNPVLCNRILPNYEFQVCLDLDLFNQPSSLYYCSEDHNANIDNLGCSIVYSFQNCCHINETEHPEGSQKNKFQDDEIVIRSTNEIEDLSEEYCQIQVINYSMINIQLHAKEESFTRIHIFDSSGILVHSSNENIVKGFNEFNIENSTMLRGIYYVRVINQLNTYMKSVFLSK